MKKSHNNKSPVWDSNFTTHSLNIYIYIYIYIQRDTEGYSKSTEPIDAVNFFASSEIRTHDLDNTA